MSYPTVKYAFQSTDNNYEISINIGTEQALPSIDNPNAYGYPVMTGSYIEITPIASGSPKTYPIPAGTTHALVYSGLWPNSGQSFSGPGSPLCHGIDRLLVPANPHDGNGQIFANDDNSITVNIGSISEKANWQSGSIPG